MAASLGHANISLAGAARLCAQTGGNPLHARMLLEQIPPRVLASGSGPLPAPRGIALAVQAKLAGCGHETRTLVTAASVLGRSAQAEVVRQVDSVTRDVLRSRRPQASRSVLPEARLNGQWFLLVSGYSDMWQMSGYPGTDTMSGYVDRATSGWPIPHLQRGITG